MSKRFALFETNFNEENLQVMSDAFKSIFGRNETDDMPLSSRSDPSGDNLANMPMHRKVVGSLFFWYFDQHFCYKLYKGHV